jgi:hypothetical protein
MALNRGKVNALNVLGLRKLSFIPGHFSKVSIDHKFDIKTVEQWIEFNLNSRYAIQVKYSLDNNRKMISVTDIGMEDPKELTMLSLGCQHLHKKKELF